jgi:acid stress chaperone HdeB
MRVSVIVFALAAALSPSLASADQLDLNTVKCKDFLQSSKENIGYTLAWLDGYYKNEDDPAVINFDKLKENAGKLGAYCAANPDIGVGTAAEQLFGKKSDK